MAGPPSFLGRGVLVAPGADAPAGWEDAPRTRIDDHTLTEPAAAIATLHHHWSQRIPVVVEVACDVNALRAAETSGASPYLLKPTFEFEKERLYFLVRANNYDNRVGRMAWGPTMEAVRLGAAEHPDADIAVDGAHVVGDGGDRTRMPQPFAYE